MNEYELISICRLISEECNIPFIMLYDVDTKKLTKQGALLVTFTLISIVNGIIHKMYPSYKFDD